MVFSEGCLAVSTSFICARIKGQCLKLSDGFFLSSYSGGFALWLDADLYHGASFSCPTFKNATLSTHEDFIVQDAEVWTVQN